MTNHAVWNVIGQLVNRPLLAHPATALTLFNSFTGRMGWQPEPIPATDASVALLAHIREMGERDIVGGTHTRIRAHVDASRFSGDMVATEDGGWRSVEPFMRTKAGVGIISITGSLVNRGAYVGAQSGVTSYEGITHQLDRVGKDPKSAVVLIDMSTPGGEAMGNAEVSERVRKLALEKPVYVIVNSLAASAGYSIAAGATEIIGTRSSLSGSIGCIMLHLDMTEAAAQQGVKPTIIQAGDLKAAGHPLVSLTPETLAELKSGVNSYYELFLDTVAKGRGERLSKKKARDTQAGTFIGKDAVTAGLIDDIGTFEEVLFAAEKQAGKLLRSSSSKPKGTTSMSLLTVQSDNQPEPTGATAPQPNPTPAPPSPQPQAAAPAGMDAVTAAIIAHADIAANAHLLSPALTLRAQAPTMSADQIVAFVKSTVPAPAPQAAAPAAPVMPTNDLATRTAEANKVAGGGQNPGAGPTGNTAAGTTAADPNKPGSITLEAAPWGKHIEATNASRAAAHARMQSHRN